MKPVVDGLQQEYEGTVEFRRYNVETDQEGIDVANRIGVSVVPTFAFVNSNGVSAGTLVGELTADQLRAKLDELK